MPLLEVFLFSKMDYQQMMTKKKIKLILNVKLKVKVKLFH